MKVILAEKPSVAKTIASFLGVRLEEMAILKEMDIL